MKGWGRGAPLSHGCPCAAPADRVGPRRDHLSRARAGHKETVCCWGWQVAQLELGVQGDVRVCPLHRSVGGHATVALRPWWQKPACLFLGHIPGALGASQLLCKAVAMLPLCVLTRKLIWTGTFTLPRSARYKVEACSQWGGSLLSRWIHALEYPLYLERTQQALTWQPAAHLLGLPGATYKGTLCSFLALLKPGGHPSSSSLFPIVMEMIAFIINPQPSCWLVTQMSLKGLAPLGPWLASMTVPFPFCDPLSHMGLSYGNVAFLFTPLSPFLAKGNWFFTNRSRSSCPVACGQTS